MLLDNNHIEWGVIEKEKERTPKIVFSNNDSLKKSEQKIAVAQSSSFKVAKILVI
jgi:hypothetical protein